MRPRNLTLAKNINNQQISETQITDKMRLCRVCLGNEESEEFQEIMANSGISLDLYFVSKISIVEYTSIGVALICSKCVEDLSDAAKLKKSSLLADQYFRKLTQDIEHAQYTEFKESLEIVEEKLEDDAYEFIDYEETVEPLEDFSLISNEYEIVETTEEPAKPTTFQKPSMQRIYQCQCGIIFSSNQRLRNHVRVKHEFVSESEMLACEICGKKFKIQEYLDLHIRNQHSDNSTKPKIQNPCSICGKILSSAVALRNHEEKHVLDSKPHGHVKHFFCDFCSLGFRMKSYLFNHMHNIHIRQKYPCSFCSQGFYKKYQMVDHVRQYHTMEKPFVCEFEGCTKSFSRKKNYTIHKRIHTGERPYQCNLCEKSFIHFIDRKRHLMKHTGERPHTCLVCSKGFMRKTELTMHMKNH